MDVLVSAPAAMASGGGPTFADRAVAGASSEAPEGLDVDLHNFSRLVGDEVTAHRTLARK